MTNTPFPACPQRPQSRSDLFWTFTSIALQGFGGVLAIAQQVLVEKKQWMSQQDFIEFWAVSQVMPGPNIVNLSMVLGSRYYGLTGALSALAGMLAIPLCIVLCLAAIYGQFAHLPQVAGALRGMSAVAAGMIMGTGLKLVFSLNTNPMGKWVCAVAAITTFTTVGLLRWSQTWVLLGLGCVVCTYAWHCIRSIDQTAHKARV